MEPQNQFMYGHFPRHYNHHMKKVSALFQVAVACEESQNTDFDSGFVINPQMIDGEAPTDGEDNDSSDSEDSEDD